MTAQGHNWKDLLRDSYWVTIAWDWFMTFLSRAAESDLWVTMVFSCYQLIPDAPQPPASVSNGVFICQLIALDVLLDQDRFGSHPAGPSAQPRLTPSIPIPPPETRR